MSGLPTLLFLGEHVPSSEYEDTDVARSGVGSLMERVKGALKTESIVALCQHHFFGSSRPEKLLAA